METNISEKSGPSEGTMRRNHVFAFLARHRFAVSFIAASLVLVVYLTAVYGMTVRTDRVSLSLKGIIERRIMPVFKKEIPLGSSIEGCNYFTLQKCNAL